MNPYLLVFDSKMVSREDFIKNIDAIPEIENWLSFFDGAICVISDLDPKELTDVVRQHIPEAHFIITNLERGKRSGWLRKSVWDFIKNPRPVSG